MLFNFKDLFCELQNLCIIRVKMLEAIQTCPLTEPRRKNSEVVICAASTEETWHKPRYLKF